MDARLYIYLEPFDVKEGTNTLAEEDIQDLRLIQNRRQRPDFVLF